MSAALKAEYRLHAFAFNQVQWDWCCELGKRRRLAKHNEGRKMKDESFIAHQYGVMGEYAASVVYDARMNTSISPNGDRHRGDIILPDGREVEVKLSNYTGRNVHLKFTENELPHMQHACLVQMFLEERRCLVYPIYSKDRFLKHVRNENYGNGPCNIVNCGDWKQHFGVAYHE